MTDTILIVDDEKDLASTLKYNIERHGYQTRVAHSAQEALKLAQQAPLPDLVLLDLMLPDGSGIDVCRHLRKQEATKDIPVVMLTARGDEIDRVVGFEIGAEDYVVKPFSMRELLLRIQVILKRKKETQGSDEASQKLQVGLLTLDLEQYRVWLKDEEIQLTALEFKLLKTLMERTGRVQSREVLLDDVWGRDAAVTTRTVDTHIKRLREKIGPAGTYIETIRSVGYRMGHPEK